MFNEVKQKLGKEHAEWTAKHNDRKIRKAGRANANLAYKGGTVAPKYDSENTWDLLFRLNASIWKDVIWWCILNTLIAGAVYSYNVQFVVATTDKGHGFMSLAVSYLLVTRTKICLHRYMTQRTDLSNLCRTCEELVSHAVSFTRFKNKDESGVKWRSSVAKRTITLLKVIVLVLRHPSTKRSVWEIHEIPDEMKDALELAVGKSNQRSPLVLNLFLRTAIISHTRKLKPQLEVSQELRLFELTTDIMSAYTEIVTYINTPYPFPLVQMTRTILIFYIYTLPFALANDITSPVPYLLIIFFITYGFIGMELICVEIDDPFGDDPNDFHVNAIANTVYENIILSIGDLDGDKAKLAMLESINTTVDVAIKNAVAQHDKLSTGEWAIMSSNKAPKRHKISNTLLDSSMLIANVASYADWLPGRGKHQNPVEQTPLAQDDRKHSKNKIETNDFVESANHHMRAEMRKSQHVGTKENKHQIKREECDSIRNTVRHAVKDDDLSLSSDEEAAKVSIKRGMPHGRELSCFGLSDSKLIRREAKTATTQSTGENKEFFFAPIMDNDVIFHNAASMSLQSDDDIGDEDDISYDSFPGSI